MPVSPRKLVADEGEQRVRLHGVSWEFYERLLEARGDDAGLRVAYLEGELELMAPGQDHEVDKKRLARLFEAWAEEMGVEIDGVGSWTVKDRDVERGAEPDECYVLGVVDQATKAPDIAIEVVKTSGGINKLEIWRLLGAREVWFWHRGALSFHHLRGHRYIRATRSALVPKLDPALLTRFMLSGGSQTEAVRSLRRALRASRKKRTR